MVKEITGHRGVAKLKDYPTEEQRMGLTAAAEQFALNREPGRRFHFCSARQARARRC
jgi:hypothetical protein